MQLKVEFEARMVGWSVYLLISLCFISILYGQFANIKEVICNINYGMGTNSACVISTQPVIQEKGGL